MAPLAESRCPLGYPIGQLREVLGDHYEAFCKWAAGSTGAICDGRATDETSLNACAERPHGPVTYVSDVRAFVEGSPNYDW